MTEKRDIGVIMDEIKCLINEAGNQGIKIGAITPQKWVDISRYARNSSFKVNCINFDMDYSK